MKVLIATGIFPPDIGGPATVLGALSDALQKNGLEVKILTYAERTKDEEKIFRIRRGHYLKYFFKMLALSRWADFIYATDTYSVGYFAYFIKKFTGKKYIIRFAGDSAWETATNRGRTNDYILDFQNKIYGRRIEALKKRRKKILISADKVIAVSNFMKNLAEKIGIPKEKIEAIYNAVDFFKNVPLWQEPKTPTLVFSGRLAKWKGVEMLIDLMPRLKEKYPEIILEIIGDGPEKENLKAGENIFFRGKVSEEESQKIFSRSTIFVLNTNYEGFSHAILNALNVGLPVITTPAGGNPEIIENESNGLLVKYNEREAWLKAVDRLLGDKNLREKFSRNGKEALKKFKWSGLVEKTIAVFKSI